jgi:hypothetical protein
MATAERILLFAGAYALSGLLFGAYFVVRGAPRIDEAVHGAPKLFRLLILPASAALWPLMFVKWLRAVRRERLEL